VNVKPLLTALVWLALPLAACGDEDPLADDGAETSGDEDPTTSGDGDGDGDEDPTTTGDGDGDGDPTTTGDGDGDMCPTEQFPAVSPAPENGAYPDPTLNVYCEGDEVFVESNGIPAYEFVALTPNPLGEQDWAWHFPRYPEVAGQITEIPLLGSVGTAVNGLPFYGPNEGPFPDPFGDPVYNGIVDFCGGHTGPTEDYHYHTMLVDCLTAGVGPDEPDPVVGYAFDGFPIYGTRGCVDADCTQIVEYITGWVETGDPTTYAWDNHEYQGGDDPRILDQCNGHVGPDGDYHYHVTDGFPHIIGCYAGTPTSNMTGMGGGGMP
jgi:hypothetical protein